MSRRHVSKFLTRAFAAVTLVFVTFAGPAALRATEDLPVFRTGADRSDITPELGSPIPGVFDRGTRRPEIRLRNSWGLTAGAIGTDVVTRVRKETVSRLTPWTEAELAAIK
jgi:hypothetical protein